ncbi:UDP-glucose 4-epimerase family protein [Trinickia fusca]|uniref:SDR family oxidoreductase n=1 Tax=Trinickia fusca TaxID=2419777 RepID=A0A494XPY8_9BURK|nr:SDR family oxidoreductase [Trinickia fusca]RKP50846.1 SDR family oxidoreductase [Trinickia fusca]
MSRIVVTGANGFVGRAVCRALVGAGHRVTGVVRQAGTCIAGVDEWVLTGADFEEIGRTWPRNLQADCVVHLAARVHVMRERSVDPLAAFRATNVEGTLRVAKAAHENGVRRVVFVSSIKAVAETDPGWPLREDDPASPQDAYGRSKLEAEGALRQFGKHSGLEVVIIRPPLVYGPGVGANFFSLMHAVATGIPLPLAAIDARRSLVYVDNLADSIARCVADARAAGECFHVADAEYLTVAELARAIGEHLQKPARLLPVPPKWLNFVGRVTGRLPQVERLTSNLRVDSAHIRAVLGWQPSHSLDDALARTVRWYRATH